VVYVQVNGTEINAYEVIDLSGRTVLSAKGTNLPVLILTKEQLGTGTFMIKVQTPFGEVSQKLVIQ
jgi:hypothetical protein